VAEPSGSFVVRHIASGLCSLAPMHRYGLLAGRQDFLECLRDIISEAA
jgi:hypothetical protein